MPKEKEHGTTLEELEELGVKRNVKSKRFGLSKLVEDFLETALVRPDSYEKMSQVKQRECDREMTGFYKAQERLRELIACCGTDAIAELAAVPTENQQRPVNLAGMRTWMG